MPSSGRDSSRSPAAARFIVRCSPRSRAAPPSGTAETGESIEPESTAAMPVLDRLLGIIVETEIVRPDGRHYPAGLEAQHQVNARRRLRQLAVDRRSEG